MPHLPASKVAAVQTAPVFLDAAATAVVVGVHLDHVNRPANKKVTKKIKKMFSCFCSYL